jgi:hypothetical protein
VQSRVIALVYDDDDDDDDDKMHVMSDIFLRSFISFNPEREIRSEMEKPYKRIWTMRKG